MALAHGSESAASGSVSVLLRIVPELGQLPLPTSVKFPGLVVFVKDIQESHSFLKEYERGHIEEGFLELSKRPRGTH